MSQSITSRLSLVWKSGWLIHSIRTAVAAAVSLAIARLLSMPEAYWAPLSTLIVMQSTLGAAWAISKHRLAGNAVGAALGGLMANFFGPVTLVLGLGIFVLGLTCGVLRIHQNAYRFACITFTIITIVNRAEVPAVIAVHRFIEVSIGIAVALALTGLWPGRELKTGML